MRTGECFPCVRFGMGGRVSVPSISIAGHLFTRCSPGEHCQGQNCEGVGSLTELISLADTLRLGDMGIAHYGALNDAEIAQIRDAREKILAAVEAACG